MEKTLVFLDAGFLSQLSKFFGKGKFISYDLIDFAKRIAENQNLSCRHIFYYTAPPFQCEKPSREESERYRRYEKFKNKLNGNNLITIREGRCQRLKLDGDFIYKQKAVDSLIVMDLLSVPLDYPEIKKIILIASDSDFVPVINKLKKFGIKTILYTYFNKNNRKSRFSTSNELIKSVSKYILLKKADFEKAELKKGGIK